MVNEKELRSKDPYLDLIRMVVNQAIEDYNRLIAGKKISFSRQCSFVSLDEVISFFLSEYFYFITGLDGKMILNRLNEIGRVNE